MFRKFICIPNITLEEIEHFVYITLFLKYYFMSLLDINLHADEVVVLVSSQGRLDFLVLVHVRSLRTTGSEESLHNWTINRKFSVFCILVFRVGLKDFLCRIITMTTMMMMMMNFTRALHRRV